MADLVTYRLEDSVARITMDDGKLNVLSPQMLAELHDAFEQAGSEGLPVILTGRENALSAGFDLKVLRSSGSEAADLLNSGFLLSERMLSHPAPVAVVCTGHAIAMGLFVVLSGDYRIGVAGPYRITANEVVMGMTLPRTPIEVCRYRLNPAYFDRVVTLAEVFTPEAAVPAGIFNRVIEPSELANAATAIATQMTALDTAAHRNTKLRTREALSARIKDAIAADDAESRATIAPAL